MGLERPSDRLAARLLEGFLTHKSALLLVYSAPEFVICNMLQQQVDAPADMDSILAAWNRYNTELLRFYNRNRDRCLLINAQTALQHPSVLLEKMADAFYPQTATAC